MDQPLIPQSVLFCCDHNAVRSPMAEAILRRMHGASVYVQSAGLRHDLEIDGFAIAVCAEIGIDLARHRARSFDEMQVWGETLDQFDLIVAMTPASQRRALELTRWYAIALEFWPILDPTGIGERREDKLAAYRETRDQIIARCRDRFPPR